MNRPSAVAHPALDCLGELTDREALIAELDEPLIETAPINYRGALQHCQPDADGFGCCAYHATWQYLRLAGCVGAVRVDGPLFVDAAARFGAAGRLDRVLVSGTADYSMLAHLAHGAARAGRQARIDILDMCETTLGINKWYAAARGLEVRTIKSSVYDFEPDERYDLVCTHSFLPWHPVDRRPLLFRRWHDWLVPGGHLCFSNRISPVEIPFDPQERADRIERMIRKTLKNLGALAVPLPCSEPEFVAMMQKLAERRRATYPEMSLETLSGWIRDAGLVLEIAVDVAAVFPGLEDVTVMTGETAGRPRMWFQALRP